jgi:hypothetical protein
MALALVMCFELVWIMAAHRRMAELPNRDGDVTVVREMDIFITVNLRRPAGTSGSRVYPGYGARP